MAIEELKEKTEEAVLERARKYSSIEITNNKKEISEMAIETLSYIKTIYPELPSIPDSVIVYMATINFIKQTYMFLAKKRTKDMGETYVDLGDFVRFSIEFGTTENADKDGTFNPKLTVKSELMYDNETPANNKIKSEAPVIDFDADIETIAKGASNLLKSSGIIFQDWRNIVQIVLAFLRVVKDYLIKHKDDNEYGLVINLAEIVDLAIEKYGEEGEEPRYEICFGPGKALKLESKGDDLSENE